jgi:hypothetical protein
LASISVASQQWRLSLLLPSVHVTRCCGGSAIQPSNNHVFEGDCSTLVNGPIHQCSDFVVFILSCVSQHLHQRCSFPQCHSKATLPFQLPASASDDSVGSAPPLLLHPLQHLLPVLPVVFHLRVRQWLLLPLLPLFLPPPSLASLRMLPPNPPPLPSQLHRL